MADSAIVGHLGTAQLVSLGVASALLTTAVSVFVFLAYATTAAVARRVGMRRSAGRDTPGHGRHLARAAARRGRHSRGPAHGTRPRGALRRLAHRGPVRDDLSAHLLARYPRDAHRARVHRCPARTAGHEDPLYVAVGGFVANAALNAGLVYGAGLGIAGSAWGTVIAQFGMAAVYLFVVVRGARKHGASLRPDAAGIRACAQAGAPLLVRTLSLRTILMIATAVAARLGDADMAAHQIILSLWSLLAFALDAIAIAGQAIIGRHLGANDAQGAREACRRMVQWGIVSGVVLGLLVIAARPIFLPLFTSDSAVQNTALPALVLVAVSQPISGVVFVLDGVLMGAGDGPYLAWAMLLTLALFTPVALLVPTLGGGLTALWGAMALMMTVRMLTLWLRSHSGRWIVTGATR